MRIPAAVTRRLHALLLRRVAERRPPDLVIGGDADPYLRRWYIIPRNRWFNAYLHHFLRSDDDRALHDHPWRNCSILLQGAYVEHLAQDAPRSLSAGQVTMRRPHTAHRVALLRDDDGAERPCWTLFLTGPNVRQWGFLCPQGWRHWRDFTAGKNGETVGKGCGE